MHGEVCATESLLLSNPMSSVRFSYSLQVPALLFPLNYLAFESYATLGRKGMLWVQGSTQQLGSCDVLIHLGGEQAIHCKVFGV